ncbi:MAG: TonB-dependent receptor [Telmatospirillum sp.]|nr:TonB-dependent receptor [Telmatospirillum sp.]
MTRTPPSQSIRPVGGQIRPVPVRVGFSHLLSSLALCALMAPGTVAAAEGDPAVETVTVTARGRAASLSETPGSVGVVTGDEITKARKDSLADALASIPGIATSGDSPWGRDISIRGLTGTSVVVLIDGKRINTATDLNARLGLVNPMDVDRVEVLKGPISALYGSGATGGVVNIITRKGHFSDQPGLHGHEAVSGTTNGLGADALTSVRYDSKDVWILGSGAFRGHDDVTGGGDADIPNSRYKDASFRLASGVKLAPDATLELSALRTQAGDVGIPGGPASMPLNGKVVYPRTSNTLLGADATWDVGGRVLKELTANVYYDRIERRVAVTNTGSPLYRELLPSADHTTIGGGMRSVLEAKGHSIVAGVDGWSWEMSSTRRKIRKTGVTDVDQPAPRARQTSIGAYLEDTVSPAPAWTINAGGRVDGLFTHNDATATAPLYRAQDHSDTGWNAHAGVTWAMGAGWSQSLLVGSGYRAADILERFKYIALPGGVTLWGDPGLKPEQTLFSEWGVGYAGTGRTADLRLFVNRIDNYITARRVSPSREVMANIGEALIYGVEAQGTWTIAGPVDLHGDVTAADGRDETANQPLRFVAPVSGKVGIGYRDGGWFALLDEHYALAKEDAVDGARATSGYVTTSLSGGYTFHRGETRHRISLDLDNLFDTRYRNYLANARGVDLIEPGLTATLNYTMDF